MGSKLKIYNELAKYYLFISQIGLYKKNGHVREAAVIKKLVKKYKKSKGKDLLIVASGLGLHDKFLKKDFDIIGVDKNDGMLKISRKINPDIKYKKADMKTFKIKKKFDVVMCMDALTHLLSYKVLEVALKNFSRHLKKDGVLLFSFDPVKKSFEEMHSKRYSKGNTEVTFIEVNHRRSKRDNKFDSCFILVVKEKCKKMKIYFDYHMGGFFEVSKIKRIMSKLGFKSYVYEGYSSKKYEKENPVFVCIKK